MIKINPSFFFPVLWLIITTILLTLPGKAFPTENWLDKIWFDKWVHIGLFAIMVYLWCRAVTGWKLDKGKLKRIFIFFALLWLAYGIGMEFVQKHFIPNRSLDPGDMIADAVGCLAGLIFSTRRYIKN